MKEIIVRWIKNEVLEAGARGIVLGLSGGVDSSVVAALSVVAMGKRRVLGLFLPCHSHPGDLKDAKIVAKKLGIKTKTINLSNSYDNILRMLPAANSLVRANLKPRLRMLVLYYFANKLNYLVCGTGNKSEVMVGYFTKHGDGATDILPIGDLFKKQVRTLAKELGIPNHIINKTPSAGLWLDQTDEGEMGLTYAELDDILGRLEQKKKQVVSAKKVAKVKRMIRGSEHKRQGPRICYVH
ncbi:MAG: NAD synthetase [Omnitrophica WOR_2 bacterium SM23_72]|nr:MAG: NAD synthetase [Omnitrophica WOR_2 bacterium SM23_72]